MFRKIAALIICFLLVFPGFVKADEIEPPTGLEAPLNFNFLEAGSPGSLDFRFSSPKSIIDLIESGHDISYELDWRINDGPWKFNKNWNGFSTESLSEHYEEYPDACSMFVYDDDYSSSGFITHWNFDFDHFDLINNTFYFRIRYISEYEVQDPATGEWGYKHVVSPYVEASIGKFGTSRLPDSLEAPYGLAGEVKYKDNGQPYFSLKWNIPENVMKANQLIAVYSVADWKIGEDNWATEKGEMGFVTDNYILKYQTELDPVDKGGWGEINIEENTYYFRIYFEFQKPDGDFVSSPFSNTIAIGTSAFYKKASTWAEPELQKANEYGLIPDSLKDVDLTQPINREEFAELAVLLYEKTTGKEAVPVAVNPFKDTKNPQVLKAFQLGITVGTSETTFSPKVLINREQCATMLFRTIKAIRSDVDFSIEGIQDFPDQKYISSWAVEATKYMYSLGIIKGDINGNFMPKATTSAQEATGYGMATREAAILMSVRTAEKLP